MNNFHWNPNIYIRMLKIVKIYESVINEAEIQACVKKFGHELFGQELGGTERDTPTEHNYLRHIEDFTDNKYGEETDPQFMSALKTLQGCMKQYPEILTPEKTKVYRGLTIPVKYFIDHKEPISLTNPNPYVYKARNKIQSWSRSFDAASIFGNHEIVNEVAAKIDFSSLNSTDARRKLLSDVIHEDLRMAFVLEYTTNPKEFIFKSKYFRMLSQAHHEDELIRIDNKPINVLAKFNDHADVFLSLAGMKLIKYINMAISELD